MARPKQKKRKTEEHDYIPDFLLALGELADLYEKEDDFRATAMRRAIIALEGQSITGVEDIKLFVLGDLKGVGKGTLGMLEEFIENGKIKRLEEMRHPKPTKEECYTFIENHEPLRCYILKEELWLTFDKNDPFWEYLDDTVGYDVVITCGYRTTNEKYKLEEYIKFHYDEEHDIFNKLRDEVQKIQNDIDDGAINFEGYIIRKGSESVKTYPFKFHKFLDDDHTGLDDLGWTPPNFEDFLSETLLGENSDWQDLLEIQKVKLREEKTGLPYSPHLTGKIKRLEEMRPEEEEEEPAKRFWKLAKTDVRKAVAELPEDIKLTVDEEDKHVMMFVDLFRKPEHPSMFRRNYTEFVVM